MLWMTQRRFAWTVRARGPAIADWPASERNAAMCLLRRSAAARDLLAEALADEDAPGLDALALERITCPVQRALAPLTPFMRGIRWSVVAVCLVGGVIGVLVGLAASGGVRQALRWSAVVSPGAIVVSVAVAALVGVGFGLYPARQASRLDPIDALRFE